LTLKGEGFDRTVSPIHSPAITCCGIRGVVFLMTAFMDDLQGARLETGAAWKRKVTLVEKVKG